MEQRCSLSVDGYRCVFKFGWIEPLKNKKGGTVVKAFKNILKTGRKPQNLWTDNGVEFYNKDFKKFLEEEGINLHSTQNEEKSSVVERWNRTIKNRLWIYSTASNSTVYIDQLPVIVDKYSKSKHRSIKMTPEEASRKANEDKVYLNLYEQEISQKSVPKFKIGDKVTISKYKRKIFDKGYTPNWTEEIFVVDKIQYTNPITYKIKDLNGENIMGTFYQKELSRATQEIFRIEKVLKIDKKRGKALVKWSGYNNEFDSWVDLSDIENINT